MNKCNNCSKFVKYTADTGTYYGCADPEEPEPYDPIFWCEKCAQKEKDKYTTELCSSKKDELNKPFWMMPNWAINSMKEAGWIFSDKPHMIKKIDIL